MLMGCRGLVHCRSSGSWEWWVGEEVLNHSSEGRSVSITSPNAGASTAICCCSHICSLALVQLISLGLSWVGPLLWAVTTGKTRSSLCCLFSSAQDGTSSQIQFKVLNSGHWTGLLSLWGMCTGQDKLYSWSQRQWACGGFVKLGLCFWECPSLQGPRGGLATRKIFRRFRR